VLKQKVFFSIIKISKYKNNPVIIRLKKEIMLPKCEALKNIFFGVSLQLFIIIFNTASNKKRFQENN